MIGITSLAALALLATTTAASAVCGGVFVIKSEAPKAAAKLAKSISAGKPVCNKPIPLEPAQ